MDICSNDRRMSHDSCHPVAKIVIAGSCCIVKMRDQNRGERKRLRIILVGAQPYDTWSNLATQHAVQIECRADQRKMSKRLWEIAQRLALGPGLFCIKPKMIRIAQHSFKEQSRLIQPFRIRQACACQRFHKPKGAHVKSTFLARESVNTGMRRIAMHEAVADKAPVTGAFKDCVYGVEHPRIGRSHEEDERHNKEHACRPGEYPDPEQPSS